MKPSTRMEVLSPDGFTIEMGVASYANPKKALVAFQKWRERFREQGYYSSNNGRIPLNELMDRCSFNFV
jgi:hypothetical protein